MLTSLRYEPATSSLRPQVRVRDPARNSAPASLHSQTCATSPRHRVLAHKPRPAPTTARRRAPPVRAQGADLCRRQPLPDRPSPPRAAAASGSHREIRNQNVESFAPPHISGSYRLRRHFPRYCDVSTRVRHPYRLQFLRKRRGGGARSRSHTKRRCIHADYGVLRPPGSPGTPAPQSPGAPVIQLSRSRFSLSPSSPGSPSSPDFPAPEHSWLPGTQFPRSSVPRRPNLLAPRFPGPRASLAPGPRVRFPSLSRAVTPSETETLFEDESS